jgi:hypothetical protein
VARTAEQRVAVLIDVVRAMTVHVDALTDLVRVLVLDRYGAIPDAYPDWTPPEVITPTMTPESIEAERQAHLRRQAIARARKRAIDARQRIADLAPNLEEPA